MYKDYVKCAISSLSLVACLSAMGECKNFQFQTNVETNKAAITHSNLGVSKWNRGDYHGAIKEYTEAIRLSPRYDLAYSNRAIAKRSAGDKVGAIADYTEAIRLSPEHPYNYFSRGLLRHQLGDDTGASSDFSQAILRDSSSPSSGDFVYYANGFLKSRAGNNAEAIKDYNEAILRDHHYSNDTTATYYLDRGLAKQRQGDFTGATEDFQASKRILSKKH
jgi:tetratricopeptide (TPR) repeat protein